MEQRQYLIDTNAVIDYLGSRLTASGMEFMNQIIDDVPNVSVITKIELLGFNAPEEHYNMLLEFMQDARITGLNEGIINESINIRKKYKTKLPDAIIAATAIFNDQTLLSRNTSDFKNIERLKVINPHDL